MTVVKCLVEGCNQEFQSSEPVSEKVTFLCRHHAPQMPADLAPKFQDYQFDRQFERFVEPLLDEENVRASQDPDSPVADMSKRRVGAAPRGN